MVGHQSTSIDSPLLIFEVEICFVFYNILTQWTTPRATLLLSLSDIQLSFHPSERSTLCVVGWTLVRSLSLSLSFAALHLHHSRARRWFNVPLAEDRLLLCAVNALAGELVRKITIELRRLFMNRIISDCLHSSSCIDFQGEVAFFFPLFTSHESTNRRRKRHRIPLVRLNQFFSPLSLSLALSLGVREEKSHSCYF